MSFLLAIPQPPALSDPVAFGVALGCAVVGAAVLLWGRKLARFFLAAAGIGAGLLISPMLIQRFSLDPLLVRIVAAAVLGAVGLLLSRLIWAALGAVVFAALSAGGLLVGQAARAGAQSAPAAEDAANELVAWATEAAKVAWVHLRDLFAANSPLVLGVLAPAALLPLVLFLFFPRAGRIIMTSLLGAIALVIGPMLAGAKIRPAVWQTAWTHWYIPLGLAGMLTVVGLAYQHRGARAADRKAKEEEEAEEEEEAAPPPPPKGKKKGKK